MKAFKWYRLLTGGVWYLNILSVCGFNLLIWSRKKRFDNAGESLTVKKEIYIYNEK